MRRPVLEALAVVVGAHLAACAPSPRGPIDFTDGGAGADAGPPLEPASIRGTVWSPGQAPGLVPAGHEIPVFNAIVYLSAARPAPIPQQTYCEPCQSAPGAAAFTDHNGDFTLAPIPPGAYWLVIQKGQFRLERELTLGEGQDLALPDDMTTLPSRTDPERGEWIPRIAMAVGNFDKLEDILGKMGLGEVDAAGDYIPESAAGVFDIYTNGGRAGASPAGTLSQLVSDLDRMLQYHIIFIPCASTSNTGALLSQQNLRNIRDYVAAGGKLYVTDWSGEWADNVFPASIELGGPGTDTPASAWNEAAGTWNTALFGTADGDFYNSRNAEVTDDDLATWLAGQAGPTADDYDTTELYDPGRFTVEGNWNTVEDLVTIQKGETDDGTPVFDTPRTYIIGGPGTSGTKKPLTVTYEPTGCGRVLYSTYHTTDDTHLGLVPQERVLLYLIMEIGVCQAGPIVL